MPFPMSVVLLTLWGVAFLKEYVKKVRVSLASLFLYALLVELLKCSRFENVLWLFQFEGDTLSSRWGQGLRQA